MEWLIGFDSSEHSKACLGTIETRQPSRISSTDLEILLYLDANHHLMRLEVPSSKVIIQRE